MDHMEVCEEGRGVGNAGYVAQLSIESRDGQGLWMLRPLSSRGSGDSSRVAGSAVVQAVELLWTVTGGYWPWPNYLEPRQERHHL